MLIILMHFAISVMKIDIDNTPTASAQSELPLLSHPPHDFARCTPSAVASTQSKLI